MIDQLFGLDESHDLFALREESETSVGCSPDAPPEHTRGTDAEGQAAVAQTCDERHPDATPPRIGRYVVLGRSSTDDHAQVFRVLHPELRKQFDLKLYPDRITDNPVARERLRHEGRLVAGCRHPNLLGIVDFDVHEHHPFVVTERVQGLSLTDYSLQRRPGPREAAGLLLELARAVDYIHSRGIVHQDLTWSNVLIDETGRPRLIDFGLARLKAAWSVEPDSPNGSSSTDLSRVHVTGQDEPVGPATDVFGLGIVLKHLLISQPVVSGPFGIPLLTRGNGQVELAARLVHPRVPRSLQRICQKATTPEQNRRYQTAAELERALQGYRRRRWHAATALVILAALAATYFGAR
jgi:eukaryotic-like serine/threonine-protein kinase